MFSSSGFKWKLLLPTYRWRWKSILFLYVSIILFGFSWGQDIELTATVNKNRILVGEKIILKLTLRRPLDQPYRLPILSGKIGKFQIKDYYLIKTPLGKDKDIWHTESIAYTMVSYEVGNQTIPPIKFSIGEKVFVTDSIFIQVDSVLLGPNQVLEPLKPNFITDGNVYWWVYPGIFLLIVLLIFLVRLVFLVLWRRQSFVYYDIASIQIEKLNNDVLVNGFTKENYFKLAQIIKKFYAEYIGNSDILSMTSNEIVIHSNKYYPKQKIFFSKFFLDTDLLKFQATNPDPSLCREQIKQFKGIIIEVKKEEKEKKVSKKRLKFSLNMG